MNLKGIMISVLVATAIPCLQAYENNYLHVRTANGITVYDVEEIDRISFTTDQMQVSHKDGQTPDSFKRSELKSMDVNESPSGVNAVTGNESALHFDATTRTLAVSADCDFEIYSLSGELMYAIPGVKAGERISLAHIHPGIVVVKAGNDSLKIALK